MRRHTHRGILTGTLAAVALALMAATAHAGTTAISVAGSTLVVTGDHTGNLLDVSVQGDRYIVDHNGPLIAGHGCQVYTSNLPLSRNSAVCLGTITHVSATLGAGNDRFAVGSSLAVTTALDGDSGDDELIGGPGIDVLDGGTGGDELVGYGGRDRADYSSRTAPVTVTIDGVANDGETGEHDLVHGTVEEVVGGSGNDHLSGSANGDRLVGGHGADTLDGLAGGDVLAGGPGNDAHDGGDGIDVFLADAAVDGTDTFRGGSSPFDEVSYAARTTAVTVDLDDVADDGASGERDNLRSDIERVTGGAGNDWLVGNALPNLLTGGAGQDFLSGREGADTLLGGLGNDVANGGDGGDGLTGGAGSDTLFGAAGDDSLQAIDGIGANDLLIGERDRDACQSDTGDTETDCEW